VSARRRSTGAARATGYALLELLVAMFVFAIMAVAAYGGLSAIARGSGDLDRAAARLKAVQLAVTLIDRDLTAVARRPVRGRYGETLPALDGAATRFELSHYAFASALEPRAALARAGYALDGRRLLRLGWPALDRAPNSEPVARAVLDDVTAFRLRYLDGANAWREEWPPRSGPQAGPESVPRAVEWRLTLAEGGEIVRLLELPEAVPGAEPAP
jgi:general secretion pathway protein J